jgi:uncharacterized protein (UPF0332 family)
MLEQAQESIAAAEELLRNGHAGFAASRAYYAMFYAASALLASLNLSFTKHSGVIAAFGQHFAANRVLNPILHKYLLEAFDTRQIGDYSFQERVGKEKAEMQIAHAREFVAAACAYLEKQAGDEDA